MKSPHSISEIQHLLKKYHIAPLRQYGQNFLHDGNIRLKLSEVVQTFLTPQPELILEIGPGFGSLTDYLLQYGLPVYLVEIDNTLIKILKEFYELPLNEYFPPDFTTSSMIIHNDVFNLDFERFLSYQREYLVTGNISYQITSPLLFNILDWYSKAPSLFRGTVLVIQKEVAQRINARPHTRQYGILSVLLRSCFSVKVPFHIQPNSFYPVPAVTSSCLTLTPKAVITPDFYFILKKLVKASFAQRRKRLYHNLKGYISSETWEEFLKVTEKKDTVRAEEISPEEYCFLAEEHRKRS